MLPKKRRLTAMQVREVLSSGKSLRGVAISLKYVVKPGFFSSAVVTPKAVAGLAVDRNRVRRALYRALSSLPPQEARILQNKMTVFFIKGIPSPLQTTLKAEVVGLLTKLPHPHV